MAAKCFPAWVSLNVFVNKEEPCLMMVRHTDILRVMDAGPDESLFSAYVVIRDLPGNVPVVDTVAEVMELINYCEQS